MATSALRYAVRRLGGGQRPHRSYAAAADDVQLQGARTVWPTSFRRANPSASSGAAANSSAEHASPKYSAETLAHQENKEYLVSIQKKKIQSKQEELFQVDRLEREHPDHSSTHDIHLLMHLSARVQPKPDDPRWCIYRRSYTFYHCMLYGWIAFLGYLAVLPSPRTRDV